MILKASILHLLIILHIELVCLQTFALAPFTISLRTTLVPRRSKKQRLCKAFFLGQTRYVMHLAPCTYPVVMVTVGNKKPELLAFIIPIMPTKRLRLKGTQSAMGPRWPGHFFCPFEKHLPQPEIKSVNSIPIFFFWKPLSEQTFSHPETLFYHIWLNTVSKGTWKEEA